MAVYSNSQIQAAIEDGRIVCVPFSSSNLSLTSLDVTIGYHYYRIERNNQRTVYNPFDKEDVERYFDGPYKALPYGEWLAMRGLKPGANIPLSHPVISIGPGERILAHTHEFFGINPPGACEIRGRSTWARNGVVVGNADWMQPGFIQRVTLEIYNTNQQETILLPVGEPIAQVIFHETGDLQTDDDSEQPERLTKYLQQGDLETTIKTWSPDMMLPKAYKDSRKLPPTIEGLAYE